MNKVSFLFLLYCFVENACLFLFPNLKSEQLIDHTFWAKGHQALSATRWSGERKQTGLASGVRWRDDKPSVALCTLPAHHNSAVLRRPYSAAYHSQLCTTISSQNYLDILPEQPNNGKTNGEKPLFLLLITQVTSLSLKPWRASRTAKTKPMGLKKWNWVCKGFFPSCIKKSETEIASNFSN